MKRYEYKSVFIWGGGEKTSRILNEYGKMGGNWCAHTGAGTIYKECWNKGRLLIRNRKRISKGLKGSRIQGFK